MLKQIIFLVLYISCLSSTAQLNMNAQLPQTGIVQKQQLWNVLLVYSGNSSLKVRLYLTLLDARQNNPVLKAKSGWFVASRGAKQLTAIEIGSVQYDFVSAEFAGRLGETDLLPAGNYLACYALRADDELNTTYAEDCIPLSIDPLQPPILNNPADGEEVDNWYPQFSWIPPTPVSIFNNLHYELKIVEIKNNQSALEAFRKNLPINNVVTTKELSYNYTSSSKKLDTGKLYAWGIVAVDNNGYASTSEIWRFKMASHIPQFVRAEDTYKKVKRDMDGAVAVSNGLVKAEYENTANDEKVTYSVISIESGAQGAILSGELTLTSGTNYLTVNIAAKARIKNGGTYLFRIKNSRGEEWHLKFTFYKPAGIL